MFIPEIRKLLRVKLVFQSSGIILKKSVFLSSSEIASGGFPVSVGKYVAYMHKTCTLLDNSITDMVLGFTVDRRYSIKERCAVSSTIVAM
jgi:hypothetical protein